MSATPGIWYHGSPNPYLLELTSGNELWAPDHQLLRWEGKRGVYFTQDFGLAQIFAGHTGRVYPVALNTRSLLVVERSEFPVGEEDRGNADFYGKLFARAEREGHDCILIPHRFSELIVLDPKCVRHLGPLIPPLPTRTPGIFFRGDYDEWDYRAGTMYTPLPHRAMARTSKLICPPPVDIITERAARLLIKPHPSRVAKLAAKARKQGFQALIFNDTCVMVLDSSAVIRQLEPERTAEQQMIDSEQPFGWALRWVYPPIDPEQPNAAQQWLDYRERARRSSR